MGVDALCVDGIWVWMRKKSHVGVASAILKSLGFRV
jgi:hypothetical protein